MNNNEILDIINNTYIDKSIHYDNIPNLDLYMEQVLTFLNKEFEQYKINSNEKIYTKSMINNYVKSKLLSKPINKKYSPNHVAELIIIFYLKQILSIEDIKDLSDNTFNKDNIKDIYEIFTNYSTKYVENTKEETTNYIKELDSDNKITNLNDKIFVLIGILISKANTYKIFSEKLIQYINQINEEEKKDINKKNNTKEEKKDTNKEKL